MRLKDKGQRRVITVVWKSPCLTIQIIEPTQSGVSQTDVEIRLDRLESGEGRDNYSQLIVNVLLALPLAH